MIKKTIIVISLLIFFLVGQFGLTRKAKAAEAMIMDNGVSVPSDFPHVDISINDNPDPGYIFIDNRGGGGNPYNIIFNNSGAPIWYLRTPDERRDFKVQPNGWLTMMIRDGYGGNGWGFIALDQNYEYVKTFRATNGYSTDEHELVVLPDSGYLLIGRKDSTVDMSEYVSGGRPNATVRETCIQEYTAGDSLIFEWRAWSHFDIRDVELEDLTGSYIRFPHMNAIDIDDDGHILLSSRHISEVTKINRQTGAIIWRLGGEHNQFEFIDDPLQGFTSQHTIRALGDCHYTVFDNGNLHNPQVSRAVEYVLDTNEMTATLVWEFRDTPDKYSHYMGNVQRLPNTNTLINWAVSHLPKLTEVRIDGSKAFEMNFVDHWECYRVHRFPWEGMALKPYLIVEPHNNNITLIFNKFGDSNVDYYNIYGGTTPSSTDILDTSKLTMKKLSNLQNHCEYYFRVKAIDEYGNESDYSNEENVFVNFIDPGQNIIINGDFAAGKDPWKLEVTGSASAIWNIEDGVSHFNVINGGNEIDEIQLSQNGLGLIQGNDYIFEFDARADEPRIIEIKVEQDSSTAINYSKIGFSALTPVMTHFEYPFKMEDQTDFNARVVINTGNSNVDVYIDNISLKEVQSEIDETMPGVPSQYRLIGNSPNPFSVLTKISFFIPQISHVNIKIYNVCGEFVQELIDEKMENGEHTLDFNAAHISAGIYFCQFEARSTINSKRYRATQKMLLIK
jgi:hypothetical protein